MQLTHLITDIQSLDQHLIHKVASAVNTSLTLRNWLIGAYIVEYEQNGSDRAEYGKKLIPTIAKSLQIKGLSTSMLWSCRSFYQTYPSILQSFLLELGRGFCFEERQKKILIGEDHYFIDLVFYHRTLKCHVLIELKVEPFTHANTGQFNTYLNWYQTNEMQE